MSQEKKAIHTGAIERDSEGNYFCGPILLDYQLTEANFKIGDVVEVRTVINNPSFKSVKQYPKKSISFFQVKENE